MQVERCPVAEEFRPFDIADPFALYARARSEEPVFYSEEIGYWVVSRYQDVHAIFRDPETFSSENTQAPFRERPAEVQRVLAEGLGAASGLSARQPPDHTRLRAFINKAFTPKRVAELEPAIREIAVRMIERIRADETGRADLVAQLTYELPALVIFLLLGVPESDVPRVKQWAESRIYLNFGNLPAEEQVRHAENVVAYWRYCESVVDARFEQLQDDLPGDLVRIHLEGDQSLSRKEMASLVYGQLTAGHETTTALLSIGLLELLRRRDQWQAICEDLALIPGAVEELLRIGSPVFAWKRRTKKPAQVAGIDIPAEANVLLLLGSANHDERQFPDPERLDVRRANARQHVAFGGGIHFCLGAPLARLEARVVLEELTARLPNIRLVEGQTLTFGENSTFRGPASILVEWEIAAPARG